MGAHLTVLSCSCGWTALAVTERWAPKQSRTHAHWDAGQAHASMHSNTQLMQTDWGASIRALILNTPTCAKHFSLSKEKHGKTKAATAVA